MLFIKIVDKEGKSIMLNVSYGLKQVDDSWKNIKL